MRYYSAGNLTQYMMTVLIIIKRLLLRRYCCQCNAWTGNAEEKKASDRTLCGGIERHVAGVQLECNERHINDNARPASH